MYSANHEPRRVRNELNLRESPKKDRKVLHLLGVQYNKDDTTLRNSK